jgi:transcriptional regulator with XRE-family HTH domain
MRVHEKIRFIRQAKGLTQEEVANKLQMSVNGYGDIERGETDVSLSRLEQIADLFEIRLSELFILDEKNIFNVNGSNNAGIGQQHCTITTYPSDCVQLQNELDKQQLINELKDKELAMKDREIENLREIITLLKKEPSSH